MNKITEALKARLAVSRESKDVVGYTFLASDPADPEALTRCEETLGYPLPPLLHEIYQGIANGGFGPGYGVMGVEGGFTDDQGETVTSLCQSFRQPDPEDPSWQWVRTWLPFCHWGCAVYSVVDCKAPFPVFYVDVSVKDPAEPMDTIIIPNKPNLESWLEDWLSGKNLWNEVWG